MKTIKLLILCLGLLCAVALSSRGNPNPDNLKSTENFQEVKINTSFGEQVINVNNNMINIYKTFQMQTGYVSIRDLIVDFSKSSLTKSWDTYHAISTEPEDIPANRKLIIKESL